MDSTSTQPHQTPQFQQHQEQQRSPSKTLPKYKQAMDELGAMVMAIADSSANGLLTPVQKRLIEDRFTQFFQQFRTPDHPPYSAMIHKAIRELNEKGGSSEESISRFLKNEYHDLPWAHYTLLKHHLGKLCDCGEIVVTRRQCYLIADAKSNVNLFTRPKRQKLKRRQRLQHWKSSSKQHKTYETKEENKWEGQVTVTAEQNKCNWKQNEVITKQNQRNEEQVEIVGQKDQAGELTNETPEEGNDRLNMDFDLFEGGNQLELSNPERPLCFDSIVVDQSVQSRSKPSVDLPLETVRLIELNVKLLSSERPQKLAVSTLEASSPRQGVQFELCDDQDCCGLKTSISEAENLTVLSNDPLDVEKCGKEQNLILSSEYGIKDAGIKQTLHDLRPTTTTSTDVESQLLGTKGQAELSNPENLEPTDDMITQDVTINLEQSDWDQILEPLNPEKSLELKLTAVEPLAKEKPQQEKHRGGKDVMNVLPESCKDPELAKMEQSSLTEGMHRQLKDLWQRTYARKAAVNNTGKPLSSLVSQDHHPPQRELPNSEKPQQPKRTPAKDSTLVMEQGSKLCSWQAPRHELENLSELESLSNSSQQQQQQQPEHRRRGRHPKQKPDTRKMESMPSGCHNQNDQGQSAYQGAGKNPKEKPNRSVVDSMVLDYQNQQKQEQLACQGRGRLPKPKPDTLVMDSAVCDLQNHHKQEQPRGRGRPPKQKLVPTATEEEFFLCKSEQNPPQEHLEQQEHEDMQPENQGCGKHPKGTTERVMTEVVLLSNSPHKPQLGQQQQPEEQMEHQNENQNEEEPACQDRGNHSKLKPIAHVVDSTMSNHQNQHEQEQPTRRGRGRCPKPKPDASLIEATMSDHQSQLVLGQLARRGRGRPPKKKLKPATGGEVSSVCRWSPESPQLEQQQERRPRNQRLGRPRKRKLDATMTEEVFFSSNLSQDPQVVLQQQQEKEQPKHKGRGRPRKSNQATFPSEEQHQQPKNQVQGRPRKVD